MICLLNVTWNWPCSVKDDDGISSLVHSFYQLSREIDTGEISSIRFDRSSNISQAYNGRVQSAKFHARNKSRSRLRAKSWKFYQKLNNNKETLEMVTYQGSTVRTCLFHDISKGGLEIYNYCFMTVSLIKMLYSL